MKKGLSIGNMFNVLNGMVKESFSSLSLTDYWNAVCVMCDEYHKTYKRCGYLCGKTLRGTANASDDVNNSNESLDSVEYALLSTTPVIYKLCKMRLNDVIVLHY